MAHIITKIVSKKALNISYLLVIVLNEASQALSKALANSKKLEIYIGFLIKIAIIMFRIS